MAKVHSVSSANRQRIAAFKLLIAEAVYTASVGLKHIIYRCRGRIWREDNGGALASIQDGCPVSNSSFNMMYLSTGPLITSPSSEHTT